VEIGIQCDDDGIARLGPSEDFGVRGRGHSDLANVRATQARGAQPRRRIAR
jgi:hypothetical protein